VESGVLHSWGTAAKLCGQWKRIDSTNPGVLAYFIRPQTCSLGTNIESRSVRTNCFCSRFEGLDEFYIQSVKRLFCGYSENQIHNS